MKPLYAQNRSIAWRDLEGESVLIDPSCGTVFVLNELGSRIWRALESPTDEASIVETIEETCSDVPPSVADEVAIFLSALRERGLIARAS